MLERTKIENIVSCDKLGHFLVRSRPQPTEGVLLRYIAKEERFRAKRSFFFFAKIRDPTKVFRRCCKNR